MRGMDTTGYFHICTEGRKLSWMFQDDDDFIAGINRIGLCYLKTGVIVMAYVLMDNHVHFVLYGTMLQCKQFINTYKRLTGIWILNKYGIRDYLRLLPTEIIRIESEESLLNTIAYLDRNPLMAGYKYMHGEYPWGSSRYAFKDISTLTLSKDGFKPISTLSRRRQRELLNSKVLFPDEWLINESGMIHPLSFLNINKLEACYKSPLRYSYFLAKKLEGIVEQELEHSRKLFIPDKDLRPIVAEIVRSNFGNKTLQQLDVNERLFIAKKLRHNYASTIKQISRMIHLEPSVLEGFI